MDKFLIAGLGNPGPQYKYTRHNAGFLAADTLAERLGADFKPDRYAEVAKARHRGKQLIIIKPQTYMNLSGKAVRYWLQKEKIPLERLLVIADDLNLPFGRIRLRAKGSHGGHNGLRHIIETLGTDAFPRLRIGIGKNFRPGEQVDYVLGKWTEEEIKRLPDILDRAAEAALTFVTRGLQEAMTRFNKKADES
ncbi:MAG: aminoacyl-tRNA hydrolase [Chlorobi bacterium]|nr:aminoacyl-tRNA hydrolase [Chlorobiota bacterium]